MAEFPKSLIRHLRQDIKKPKAWVSLIVVSPQTAVQVAILQELRERDRAKEN